MISNDYGVTWQTVNNVPLETFTLFMNVNDLYAIQTNTYGQKADVYRSQDRGKSDEIEAWVDRVAESSRILPMDGQCFREWGRLMNGKPDRLVEDAMIAATARIHNLVVATRNERDFRDFEVSLLNPFKSS